MRTALLKLLNPRFLIVSSLMLMEKTLSGVVAHAQSRPFEEKFNALETRIKTASKISESNFVRELNHVIEELETEITDFDEKCEEHSDDRQIIRRDIKKTLNHFATLHSQQYNFEKCNQVGEDTIYHLAQFFNHNLLHRHSGCQNCLCEDFYEQMIKKTLPASLVAKIENRAAAIPLLSYQSTECQWAYNAHNWLDKIKQFDERFQQYILVLILAAGIVLGSIQGYFQTPKRKDFMFFKETLKLINEEITTLEEDTNRLIKANSRLNTRMRLTSESSIVSEAKNILKVLEEMNLTRDEFLNKWEVQLPDKKVIEHGIQLLNTGLSAIKSEFEKLKQQHLDEAETFRKKELLAPKDHKDKGLISSTIHTTLSNLPRTEDSQSNTPTITKFKKSAKQKAAQQYNDSKLAKASAKTEKENSTAAKKEAKRTKKAETIKRKHEAEARQKREKEEDAKRAAEETLKQKQQAEAASKALRQKLEAEIAAGLAKEAEKKKKSSLLLVTPLLSSDLGLFKTFSSPAAGDGWSRAPTGSQPAKGPAQNPSK